VRLRLNNFRALRLNLTRTFFSAPGATEKRVLPRTTRLLAAAVVAPLAPGSAARRKPPQTPVWPAGHSTLMNTPKALPGGAGDGTPAKTAPPPPQTPTQGPSTFTGGGVIVIGGGVGHDSCREGSPGWQS
jgi:hypothetical protein